MAESKTSSVPLMTRLPKRLHEAVKKFSQGNGKRPKASLNDTIIFLLEQGLRAEGVEIPAETTPGQPRAARLAA